MNWKLVKFKGGSKNGKLLWIDLDITTHEIPTSMHQPFHPTIVIEVYVVDGEEVYYKGNRESRYGNRVMRKAAKRSIKHDTKHQDI